MFERNYSEWKTSDRNNCTDKTEAKFPAFTEMIRGQFDRLAAVEALDSYTALDLPHIKTVKDTVKQECDAGFHQTLKKECGKVSSPATYKHWQKMCLSLNNVRLMQFWLQTKRWSMLPVQKWRTPLLWKWGLWNLSIFAHTEVGAACCEHCHPKEEFVNEILVALCQIPLWHMLQKSPCRRVGVNGSSLPQSAPPPLALIISKKALFPPLRQSSPHSFLQSSKQKQTCRPPLCPTLLITASHLCVCVAECCFLYLIIEFMLLASLWTDSCLLISNLYICTIGHFKEQSVWFKRQVNMNELPPAEAKGKSTAIQTNTKARKWGGQYEGGGGHWQLSPAALRLWWGSARGERVGWDSVTEEKLNETEEKEEEEGWG